MKLIQIVFGSTGRTQKVADIITKEWKGAVTHIDLGNLRCIINVGLERV